MLIPIIVIAVMALLMAFFLFKSAETWNWVQITFCALIFLTAIFAGISASQSFKTRYAWMDRHVKNKQLLEDSQKAFDVVIWGSDADVAYGAESLRGVNAALNLEQIGKGRMWSSGNPTVDATQISVQFSAGADQSSPMDQILQDMLLYGFADGVATIGEQQVSVPVRFLGSFKVTAVDNTAVKFEPVFVVDQAEVGAPTSSWTFFEKMPSDNRDAFKEDLGWSEDDFDITQYREALKTKYLPAEMFGLDPASVEYEELLDEYTFDGLPLNEINTWISQQRDRINDRFDPDPQQRRVTIRYGGKSQSFTVDGTGKIDTDGPFNSKGEAIDPLLFYGKDIDFAEGDEITIDKLTAELGYSQSDGSDAPAMLTYEDAEIVNEYFVRETRDYPYLLQELGVQTQRLIDAKARVDRNIEDTNVLVTNAERQQDNRNEIIAKLQSDISMMQKDLELVNNLLARRTREYQQKQEQIKTYYKQILEMYEQSKSKGDLDTSHLKIQRGLAKNSR